MPVVGNTRAAVEQPACFRDILPILVQHIDNHSLLLLSLLCKDANRQALTSFFTRNNIRSPLNGWLVARLTPVETLTAIRKAAIFAPKLQSFDYYFNPNQTTFLREMREARYLLQHSRPIPSVRLHLETIDSWVEEEGTQPFLPCITEELWRDAFVNLLDATAKNGCEDLSVVGGETLASLFSPLGTVGKGTFLIPKEVSVLIGLAAGDQDGSDAAISAQFTTSLHIQDGVDRADDHQDENKDQSINLDGRGESIQPTSPTDNDSSWKPPTTFSSLYQKLFQKVAPAATSHHPVVAQTPPSIVPTPLPAPFTSDSRLKSITIHSDMMFQDPFYTSTIAIFRISSSSLTEVSFECPTVTQPVWSHFLPLLHLPCLESFQAISISKILHRNGIAFPDIHDFLKRHPTIETLHLHSLAPLSSVPPLHEPILPNLVTLTAHPHYVMWILQSTSAFLPSASLPNLKSITIAAERVGPDIKSAFDYSLFDQAAGYIPYLSQSVELCFQIGSFPAGDLWVQSHISNPNQSVLRSLTRVKHLAISSSFTGTFEQSTLNRLSSFVNLFPDVQILDLKDQSVKVDAAMRESDLPLQLARDCPNLQTLYIGFKTPFDIVTLRRQVLVPIFNFDPTAVISQLRSFVGILGGSG